MRRPIPLGDRWRKRGYGIELVAHNEESPIFLSPGPKPEKSAKKKDIRVPVEGYPVLH
jgi:hypothetical protein